MTEAKKILEMIEGVSPDDTDTLDEIDARVKLYIDGDGSYISSEMAHYCRENYSTSRDALKDIRPEECLVDLYQHNNKEFSCSIWGIKRKFNSPTLPTEELAELHAIIQAIQWERDND